MPKVKYGLKNVHYAIVTETTDSTGAVTSSYGTVKAWPGAVNISLDAQGDDTPFYADDGTYYMAAENVLPSSSRPLIHTVSHGAGWSDGVDAGNFRERIGNMRSCGVAVHGLKLSSHDGSSSLFR